MRNMVKSAVLSLGITLVASVAYAQINWDLSNEYAQNSLNGQIADTFIQELSKASNGEITITAHHGAALGYKTADHFDAVGDGAIEVASSFVGPWAGIHPVFLVSALPFVATSFEDSVALYEGSKPYYDKVLAESNQVFLFATPWPPVGLWGNKPLDSLEAIRSVRIRTYDPPGTLTFREAGASPIQLSWADTVPQLSTGGIEAVKTSAEGGAAAQLWEHQSHFTELNYALPLQIFHMNKGTYDALTDDQRAAVSAAASAAEAFGWDLVRNRVRENYAEMREHNMTIVEEVSEEYIRQLQEASQGAIEEWKSKFSESESLLTEFEAARSK